MNKSNIHQLLLLLLLSVFSLHAFAWNRSIELGYGGGHDPNNVRYNNTGFFLSGDMLPLRHTSWTYWSLNGALGQWHSTAPTSQNLTTAAVALALRLYPFTVDLHYPVYVLASAGPALLSNRSFGVNTQGSNFTFQWNGGFGVEFNHLDINLRIVHFSNAHIIHPDQGFNFLTVLSVGYLI